MVSWQRFGLKWEFSLTLFLKGLKMLMLSADNAIGGVRAAAREGCFSSAIEGSDIPVLREREMSGKWLRVITTT